MLLFGAGTGYALLIVVRYREGLRRHEDRHEAVAVVGVILGTVVVRSILVTALGLDLGRHLW